MALSATFTQCAPTATEFGEITQNRNYIAVKGHSRSPILVPTEDSYDFLSMINTNLPLILHRLRDIAFEMSKIAIFGNEGGFFWDDLRKFLVNVSGLPRYLTAYRHCRKFQPAK